jgi:parallel beta-helix repeat protein
MKKRIGTILVCILLIALSLVIFSPVKALKVNSNTLCVGGTGPGNYSSIQDAIDDAIDGDFVYVYDDSSPYYESLILNKSITLFGEDKYSTVIDSNGDPYSNEGECCISITDDFVSVSGFTLTNKIPGGWNTGIYVNNNCENIIISNNIIKNTNRGIFIDGSSNNFIDSNVIRDVIVGIDIRNYADNNVISNNTIKNSSYKGIEISHFSSFNTITRNKIINGVCTGIELSYAVENNIFLNSIELIDGNWIVISENSFNNTISQNNFLKDRRNWIFSVDSNNIWDGNYWGKGRILPRFIPVFNYVLNFLFIFNFDIDWHPATNPYDIP